MKQLIHVEPAWTLLLGASGLLTLSHIKKKLEKEEFDNEKMKVTVVFATAEIGPKALVWYLLQSVPVVLAATSPEPKGLLCTMCMCI